MTDITNGLPKPHSQLIEHLNRGDCVLFVGDVLDGEYSQSKRLASALVDADHIYGACDIFTCRSGGKCIQPNECAVPLTRAAQLYESRNGRQSLEDFVIRYVSNNSSSGQIDYILADLPVQVIITTIFDDRLERALKRTNRKYLSIVRDVDVPFDDPDRIQIIRLHGTISQPGTLKLTEDDSTELFNELPTVTKILQAHFASKTLLFVGYRLEDLHFLTLYNQVTGVIGRNI